MNAYIDASVILRVLFRQRGALREWSQIDEGVSSAIVEVECHRTIDRLRLAGKLAEREAGRMREATYSLLESFSLVMPTAPVLSRAGQPLPVTLRTLDALHLATALLIRDAEQPDLVMATHDTELAIAARAMGLRVIGV